MPDRSSSGALILALALTGLTACQSVQTPFSVAPRQLLEGGATQSITLASDDASAIVDARDAQQLASGVERVMASAHRGLEVSQDSTGPVFRINRVDGQGLTAPLFVIDGIPVADGFVLKILSRSIERIDLFRDSASTAPYGARAAHGVVSIATIRRN